MNHVNIVQIFFYQSLCSVIMDFVSYVVLQCFEKHWWRVWKGQRSRWVKSTHAFLVIYVHRKLEWEMNESLGKTNTFFFNKLKHFNKETFENFSPLVQTSWWTAPELACVSFFFLSISLTLKTNKTDRSILTRAGEELRTNTTTQTGSRAETPTSSSLPEIKFKPVRWPQRTHLQTFSIHCLEKCRQFSLVEPEKEF